MRKNPINPNCRFNRSYVRATKTYTLSFKGLTKHQADIVSHIFCTLNSCGIVYTYLGGFTFPELELRCSVPLERGYGSTLVVPNASLSALAQLFKNRNFATRDVITSSNGLPISKLNTY
uniref:Uncharacterized protein n=1 Tax=Dulem virus 267 TaxID=3145744 RepID=A0AAU8AUW7_9VIRU